MVAQESAHTCLALPNALCSFNHIKSLRNGPLPFLKSPWHLEGVQSPRRIIVRLGPLTLGSFPRPLSVASSADVSLRVIIAIMH